MADCMQHLGYQSCKADLDIWLKPCTRPDNGYKYYAYVLLYIDNCLVLHHNDKQVLLEIDKYFPMKKGLIRDLEIYLGAKLRKVTLDNLVEVWSMSSSKYVQEAVQNVEEKLVRSKRTLSKQANILWRHGYEVELDNSPMLDASQANYYQSLIATTCQ